MRPSSATGSSPSERADPRRPRPRRRAAACTAWPADPQDGVARVLELLRDELLDAMTLAGLGTLDGLGPDTVLPTASHRRADPRADGRLAARRREHRRAAGVDRRHRRRAGGDAA